MLVEGADILEKILSEQPPNVCLGILVFVDSL